MWSRGRIFLRLGFLIYKVEIMIGQVVLRQGLLTRSFI